MRASYSAFVHGLGSSTEKTGMSRRSACAATSCLRTACIATRSASPLNVTRSRTTSVPDRRTVSRASALSFPLLQLIQARAMAVDSTDLGSPLLRDRVSRCTPTCPIRSRTKRPPHRLDDRVKREPQEAVRAHQGAPNHAPESRSTTLPGAHRIGISEPLLSFGFLLGLGAGLGGIATFVGPAAPCQGRATNWSRKSLADSVSSR